MEGFGLGFALTGTKGKSMFIIIDKSKNPYEAKIFFSKDTADHYAENQFRSDGLVDLVLYEATERYKYYKPGRKEKEG